MKTTIKLYDGKPYETEFDGTVVSVTPGRKKNTLNIVLDRTLFFPEEGGQTPDRGVLDGFQVIDVQIRDNIITHTVQYSAPKDPAVSQIPSVGQTVHGSIDWEHRYSNMQNHSGEHILSGLLHSIYGYENVGFRLSDNTVTLDTSGQLDDKQIDDLEMRANAAVWSNVAISCRYPSADELANMEYRSKKAIEGPVRIVTIEGIDCCACCAPHVARTGEIGLIKILNVLHEKNSMRLTIVSGKRALLEVQKRQRQIEQISHLTSMEQDKVTDGVQRLLDENNKLKLQLTEKERQAIIQRLSQIPEGHEDIWLFESGLSAFGHRDLVNGIIARGHRFGGVFLSDQPLENADKTDQEINFRVIIGAGRGEDARAVGNLLKSELKFRGGGKPEMIQGQVHASRDQILAVLTNLTRC